MHPPESHQIPRPPGRQPRAGDLLIAAPSLQDPNFRRTIIYLLQHDDEGSAGVIINRRLEYPLVGVELPQWLRDGSVVHAGGPVAEDSLLALAAETATPEQVRQALGPGVCVVDLEAVADVPPFHPVQLFVGYAGWSPGQLGDEIMRRDWFVADSDPMDVLGTDPDVTWERVLRRQPSLTRLWATLPHDVAAN